MPPPQIDRSRDRLRRSQRRTAWILSIGLFWLASCSTSDGALDVESLVEVGRVDARSFVTADIARGLDAEGFFSMVVDPTVAGQIDADYALTLATGFVQSLATFIMPALEDQHGSAIDLAKLKPLWITYGQTPYQAGPDTWHPGDRNILGPYFIVHLGYNGKNVVSLAVSAYDNAVQVIDGEVWFPPIGGNDFLPVGVPNHRSERSNWLRPRQELSSTRYPCSSSPSSRELLSSDIGSFR